MQATLDAARQQPVAYVHDAFTAAGSLSSVGITAPHICQLSDGSYQSEIHALASHAH